MVTTCKNCNKKFIGHYCNYCGQSADTHDINFKYLWHELQHGIFHLDKGIIHTTKELFTRPGHSIKEYIAGKRVKHFKPVAYIIVLSTIYVLLAHLLHVETTFDEMTVALDGSNKAESNEIIHFIHSAIKWLQEHYAYSMLMLLPVISLSSYLTFRKSGYNYLQHLILNCYIAGQRMIVFILLLPAIALFSNKEAVNVVENIETLIWISLMTWTYIQFFDNNKISKNIRLTIFSYLLFGMFFLVLLISIIVLAALFFGK